MDPHAAIKNMRLSLHNDTATELTFNLTSFYRFIAERFCAFHMQGVLTSFGWKAFSEPKLEIGFFRQKLVKLKGYLHYLTDM